MVCDYVGEVNMVKMGRKEETGKKEGVEEVNGEIMRKEEKKGVREDGMEGQQWELVKCLFR